MSEHVDLGLDELRALLERIERRQLEAGDWAVVDAVLAKTIEEAEQAEPGEEWVTIRVSEDGGENEDASVRGGQTTQPRIRGNEEPGW